MVEAKAAPKVYETYKKISTLGTGSFGTAYLVECQSDRVKLFLLTLKRLRQLLSK